MNDNGDLETGDPVSKLEDTSRWSLETGVVVELDARVIEPGVRDADTVRVRWADGSETIEHVGDLMVDVQACHSGGDPRGGGCGDPCVPGSDRCPRHGGPEFVIIPS